MNARKSTIVGLLLFGSACSSSPAGTDTGYGGYVSLEHERFGAEQHAYGYAEFFAEAPTQDFDRAEFESLIPIDGCIDAARLPMPPSEAGLRWKDVGARVDLVEGATAIALHRDAYDGVIWYSDGFSIAGATVPRGTGYDVVFPGGGAVAAQTWTDALRLPASPEYLTPVIGTAGTIVLSSSDALDLSFTPSDSDEVILHIGTHTGAGILCRYADDGTFTVPAEFMAMVPVDGTIVATNYAFEMRDLEGRHVALIGRSSVFSDYVRQ